MFVGRRYLEGYPAIAKRLEAVIADQLAKGAVTFDPKAVTQAKTGQGDDDQAALSELSAPS